jgi:deoxyribonuclease V
LTSSLYSDITRLQKEIAKHVITEDIFEREISYICGVDVSYKKNIAYCSAAVIKKNTLELIECVKTKYAVEQPYIPGFFILREAKPIMGILNCLKTDFEVLLIDGHGQLHPRRCGLACHIGVIIDMPTIGVAKSLLCGNVREDQFIELDGDILGFRIKTECKKPIYVSVGHKICLESATEVIKRLVKNEEWLPEPLRIADISSKDHLNFK